MTSPEFCDVNTTNVGIFFRSFSMAEHLLCRLSLFVRQVEPPNFRKATQRRQNYFVYLLVSINTKHPLTKTNAEPLERVSVDSKILFVP